MGHERRTRAIMGAALSVCLLLAGCTTAAGLDRGNSDDHGRAKCAVPQPGGGAPKGKDHVPSRSLAPAPVRLLSGNSTKLVTSVKATVDQHLIPITLYRPVEATRDCPVPLLLHSHGWAGNRTSGDDAFRAYHRAGFAVLSMDMRGHGDAKMDSAARVDDMDFEIKDVQAVITYVATLDWVQLDGFQDPHIGALGGSYGGGYQLLTAAVDPRLDAIAPDITWNNLVQSLAPNGDPKSAWLDLLYWGGNAAARLDPEIHESYVIAETQNRVPDGSQPGEPALVAQLLRSSPASYPTSIRIPTLLTQGSNDTLFNVNQAIANYHQIQATGAPVQLVTHLNGHILNTRGTIPVASPVPVGLQSGTGGSPCGNLRNITIAFYQVHLLGLPVDAGPNVCLAMQDGTVLRGSDFPLPGTLPQTIPIPGSTMVPQGAPAPNATLSLLTASSDQYFAGIPILAGRVTSVAPDAIIYYSLQIKASDGSVQTVNAQVTPQRLGAASGQGFRLELGAIELHLKQGQSLQLVVANMDPQFAHNAGRVPGLVTLTDLRLEVPLAPSPA